MTKNVTGWLLFIILSVIWGSSFILMKLGMLALSPYQVASLRISSAGLMLFPFALKAFKTVEKGKRLPIFLTGLLGSFLPAYLYCIAEVRIDSSLAAIFNSLTPLFTILIGAFFFKLPSVVQRLPGVLLGFSGLVLLPFAAQKGIDFTDLSYSLLVVLATICYACNVNLVSRYLMATGSLNTASLSFFFLFFPAFIILAASGYFDLPLTESRYLNATFAACTLGMIGTALATVLFYMLVKKSGALFASLVTYGIPVVALIWGIIYGEQVGLLQIGCLAIILTGVYLSNRK